MWGAPFGSGRLFFSPPQFGVPTSFAVRMGVALLWGRCRTRLVVGCGVTWPASGREESATAMANSTESRSRRRDDVCRLLRATPTRPSGEVAFCRGTEPTTLRQEPRIDVIVGSGGGGRDTDRSAAREASDNDPCFSSSLDDLQLQRDEKKYTCAARHRHIGLSTKDPAGLRLCACGLP